MASTSGIHLYAANKTLTELNNGYHYLRIVGFTGFSIMTVLCFLLLFYLRYNRHVAFKGDTDAARKILLPAFEPLLWILGVANVVFTVANAVLLPKGNINSKVVSEAYYAGRQFELLIVLVYLLQKSVSIPALRRSFCITLVMAMYTIPLEALLSKFADDTTNYYGLVFGRSLLVAFYAYIFVKPPGRASTRTLRQYCVFAGSYSIMNLTYNGLLRAKYLVSGFYLGYLTAFWASMCPYFIWRVLRADTEYWRGMGQRACALQSLFRQKHTINERISSQGLHVLIEMHRKYIIDFAHLELKQRIGVGSSATVFNGILHSNIPVAIKVYTPTNYTEDTVAEFSHEAALCGALNHPNIVKFYGMCVFPPTICLVSELCQGSLDDVTCANARRRHPENRQQDLINIGYMIDAARAVAYFHSFTPAFLHRDIKPTNFLVDAVNNVKLTDFGESRSLARSYATQKNNISLESGANIRQVRGNGRNGIKPGSEATSNERIETNKMTVKGTVDYMAPEIINGKAGFASYAEAADVYSLAVTLWDILNPGVEKFPTLKSNHLHILEFVVEGNRPQMNANEIHPSLRNVIESAWQADPGLRPTAKAIVHILESIQQEMYGAFVIDLIDTMGSEIMASSIENTTVSSFAGDLAVGHMERMQYASSQAEAIRIGSALMDTGLLHHVKHSQPFENSDSRYYFDEECIRLCQPIWMENNTPPSRGNIRSFGFDRFSKHSFRRASVQSSQCHSSEHSEVGLTAYSHSDQSLLESSNEVCACRKLGQRLGVPKVSRRRFRRRFKAFSEENVLTAKLLAPVDVTVESTVGFDDFDCVAEAEEPTMLV